MIWKNFWIYKTIHSEGFEKGGLWRKRRDFGLEVYLYCREKQGKIKSIYWCGGYSYSIRGWWLVLRKEFDISQFDKYREDNRREVKKATKKKRRKKATEKKWRKKDKGSMKKFLLLWSQMYGTKQVI